MKMRIQDVIDPAERLWILDSIHAELESNHKGDPQLWSMTLTELVNRPDNEFESMNPARLGLLRRIYMKFKIPKTED